MEDFREIYEKELAELGEIANAAENDLRNAPPGTLRVAKNNNTEQYYWRTDSKDTKGKYIRKSETEVIKKLAQKEYAQKILTILGPIIKKKRKAIAQMQDNPPEERLLSVYEHLSAARQKLVTPYLCDDDAFAKQWESEKRQWKELRGVEPETEIYTEKGERVRSKSEKILADKLYMMGIPYVYEAPLHLRGYGYIKPDFTVLNKRTRREYYWEHLGMMGNLEYCEKAIRKIESYQKSGCFPGKDLLLTYETSQHPLNVKIVEGIVTEYLL